MNILYSILTTGTDVSESQFAKPTTLVYPTQKAINILAQILPENTGDAIPLFASVLCYMCRYSIFGKDIKELDPENSYHAVAKGTSTQSFHSMTKPISAYNGVLVYLDSDIQDRLSTFNLFDLLAGCCLQLLREVSYV